MNVVFNLFVKAVVTHVFVRFIKVVFDDVHATIIQAVGMLTHIMDLKILILG